MDGLKLYLEQASDCVVQNRYYNGWTHDHYVSTVLVFCPDGTIPIVMYNIPGFFMIAPLQNGATYTEGYKDIVILVATGLLILYSARTAMNF